MLAAYTDGDQVHMMLELKDLEGKRLSDGISVFHDDSYDIYTIFTGAVEFDEAENRATAALTIWLAKPVEEGDLLSIDIDAILSGSSMENAISGPWNLSFKVDTKASKKTLSAYPADSPYYERFDIVCTPIYTEITVKTVSFTGDYEEFIDDALTYFCGFETPTLVLEDGSVVTLLTSAIMFEGGADEVNGSADYESPYFEIDQLKSITVCGEEFYFDECPS